MPHGKHYLRNALHRFLSYLFYSSYLSFHLPLQNPRQESKGMPSDFCCRFNVKVACHLKKPGKEKNVLVKPNILAALQYFDIAYNKDGEKEISEQCGEY